MTQPLTSPRTGARKTTETAIDMTLLALAIPFGFSLLRQRWSIPPDLESSGTAFMMALGAVVARWARHWWVYRGRVAR